MSPYPWTRSGTFLTIPTEYPDCNFTAGMRSSERRYQRFFHLIAKRALCANFALDPLDLEGDMPIDCEVLQRALQSADLKGPLTKAEVDAIKACHNAYLTHKCSFWWHCKDRANTLGFLFFCLALGCFAMYVFLALLVGISFPFSVVYMGSGVQQIGTGLLLGAFAAFILAFMTVLPERICDKVYRKMHWRQQYINDPLEELPPRLAAAAKVLGQQLRKRKIDVLLGKEESAKGVFLFLTQGVEKKRTYVSFEEKRRVNWLRAL